ncbi:hypothetical protein J3U68_07970 [Snodgrassella sp. B3882]|uniref:hypothetical protein n=1 Tax=Snodgrassella sp. B3882 TaxID=2818037 RepID=UPI0022698D36|nr:hypothetical protein [Snodgrassella sp. B3882]MCX8745343.1 hypothetical protein [Snodgrassella sp. B3882]
MQPPAQQAQLAADYLISQLPKDKYPEAINPLTGEIDPNRLPEEVKSTIRDLSSAVASVAGGNNRREYKQCADSRSGRDECG